MKRALLIGVTFALAFLGTTALAQFNDPVIDAPGSAAAIADLDMDGWDIILDADADTRIENGTDDAIRLFPNGAESFKFTATAFSAVTTANYIDSIGGVLELGSDTTTSHTLVAGDVVCGDDFEVNGVLYADGNLNFQSGDTFANTAAGHLTISPLIEFGAGTAITAATYAIGRDADATNQMHFNAPTGAGFEFSINDVAEMTLNATDLALGANNITTTGTIGGGVITGTSLAATIDDAATNSATTMQTLTHTSSGVVASGFGIRGSYVLEDLGGAEEQAAIKVSMLDVTDAAEDAKITMYVNSGGTIKDLFHLDGESRIAAFGTDGSTTLRMIGASDLSFGGSSSIALNTTHTPDQVGWGLPASGNAIVFYEQADGGFDFAHPLQASPTIFVQSATQSTTEWISLAHNATDGVIATGAGDLSLAPAGLDVVATGKFSSATTAITIGTGITTFAATRNVHTLACTAAETLATITGGITGQMLTLLTTDANCTITDTAAATADTMNLSASLAFTSSANDTITFVSDGNKWFEVSRSVN